MSAGATIVFVEIGRFPDWLIYAIRQVRIFSPESRIILATDQPVDSHRKLREFEVEIHTVCARNYRQKVSSEFRKKYKKVFWENCSLRFFILQEVIREHKLKNVLHLESDYMLYVSVTEIVRSISDDVDIGLCSEKDRIIPGFVFIKDSNAADTIAQTIAEGINGSQNDMESLYSLIATRRSGVHLFRTQEWVDEPNEFNTPYIQMEGYIFDAACLGMYLMGEQKNPATPYWNKNSSIHPDDLVYFLNPMVCDRPVYLRGSRLHRIAGLHIHSKTLRCVATYNECYSPFSGDKLFLLCDSILASPDRFPYLQSIGIPIRKFKSINDLYLPAAGEVVGIFSDEVINFPSEYLQLLKVGLPAIYILHNSDQNLTPDQIRQLLGDRNIVYAQNLTSVIPGLPVNPLPIGVQNSKWPGVTSSNWHMSARDKKWSILSALSKTHRSRLIAVSACVLMARRLSHLEKRSEIGLHSAFGVLRFFLRKLNPRYVTGYKFAPFKWVQFIKRAFFVYSPRGNGLDTHRFWEAQIFGSIPVVPASDFIPAYKGYPVVIGNLWRFLFRPVKQAMITDAMINRNVEDINSINTFTAKVNNLSSVIRGNKM